MSTFDDSPWYSDEEPWRDIRLVGELSAILEIADMLHERTPYLAALYHRAAREGILFTRINESKLHALSAWKYRRDFEGAIKQSPLEGYALLRGNRSTHPWLLRDLETPLPDPPLHEPFFYTPSEPRMQQPLRYYRFYDTPDAAIARLFASHHEVYSYDTATGIVSYIALSAARIKTFRCTIASSLPTLTFQLRFNLPYESTSIHSPIQRPYPLPDYL